MKQYTLQPSSITDFLNGLVFGFDLGTGSIGYAVRRGAEFLDVGVLICDSDIGALDGRNGMRRMRRTLRSRTYRRKWTAQQLERIGLAKPQAAFFQKQEGETHAAFQQRTNPVILRCRALAGEKLSPEQLNVAVAHLWKRRGYEPVVPWSKDGKPLEGEDEWKGTVSPGQNNKHFQESECSHPALFLKGQMERRDAAEAWPKGIYDQRRRVWQRDLLEQEFRAMIAAQPALQKEITVTHLDEGEATVSFEHWLLYGDGKLRTRHGKEYRWYDKPTEGRNPGVLGLKWPRFSNRSPGLDALRPYDEKGRPQHVVSKDAPIARKAMWELATANFRVTDLQTGKRVRPSQESLDKLKDLWLKSLKKKDRVAYEAGAADFDVDVSAEDKKNKKGEVSKESLLTQWATLYQGQYALLTHQPDLVSAAGEGRTRYSSPTIQAMFDHDLEALQKTPQPLLVRPGQSREDAMNAFLADVRSPVVRHRLTLLLRLIERLVKEHGTPKLIIVEAARSFGLGRKAKEKHMIEVGKNKKEREQAKNTVKKEGYSSGKTGLTRYRLWKEAAGRCPFCGEAITIEEFRNKLADIAHIVPQSVRECHEFYNLTIAHSKCNRMDMENKIPRDAFGHRWAELEAFARTHFKDRKLELFLAPALADAQDILDSKDQLCMTAHLSKLVRRLCIIRFGWEGKDGRDPTTDEGNLPSQQFLVTNGSLTSALRGAWGINTLLHRAPCPTEDEWQKLSEDQRKVIKQKRWEAKQKNRGDHRHHGLDAMVITCTLPWLARRVIDRGENAQGGLIWWKLSEDRKKREAINPAFPEENAFRHVAEQWRDKMEVRHHVANATHKQPAKTMFYSRRGIDKFILREDVTSLTPKNLHTEGNRQCRVHPEELGRYLHLLWTSYSEDLLRYLAAARDALTKELPITKDNQEDVLKDFKKRLCFTAFESWRVSDRQNAPELPVEPAQHMRLDGSLKTVIQEDKGTIELPPRQKLFKRLTPDFARRLCFTAFQKWRAKKQPDAPAFPVQVRIPIPKVRYDAKLNLDNAVPGPKTMPGYGGHPVYVQRTDFREVRIMPATAGDGYVPVFVPLGAKYPLFSPFGDYVKEAEAMLTIRKRQRIKLVQNYSEAIKTGEYVVEKLSVDQPTISLSHVARPPEARKAFGMPAKAYQPYWKLLLPALGIKFSLAALGIEVSDSDEGSEDAEELDE